MNADVIVEHWKHNQVGYEVDAVADEMLIQASCQLRSFDCAIMPPSIF